MTLRAVLPKTGRVTARMRRRSMPSHGQRGANGDRLAGARAWLASRKPRSLRPQSAKLISRLLSSVGFVPDQRAHSRKAPLLTGRTKRAAVDLIDGGSC